MRWKSVLPVAVALGRARLPSRRSRSSPSFDLGGGHDDDGRPAGRRCAATTPRAAAKAGLTAREIYKRDAPGVVFIRAQVVEHTQSPFDFGLPQQQRGRGHRLGLRRRPRRHDPHQRARRRRRDEGHRRSSPTSTIVDAKIARPDESTDLALLQGRPERPASCTRCRSARRKDVQVGDPTIAIGNPFGLERTLTTGVVSALAAPDPGAQRLRDRRRHPDRRGDQPRQLRRSAARRDRPGDRRSTRRSRPAAAASGQRRHRLRDPDRHRQAACIPQLEKNGRGRPRLPRRRRA